MRGCRGSVGLVQAVVVARGEQARVPRGDRRPKERRPRNGEHGVGPPHRVRQGLPRCRCRDVGVRNDRNWQRRKVVRDPGNLAVPGQADAARERRREVVGVPLEPESGLEQLLDARLDLRRPGACDEAERDDRGARPEPALTGDAARPAECPGRRRGVDREGAHAEMRFIGAIPLGQLELVPEIERGSGCVESGAEVGRRRGCAEARHGSIAAGSFRPWPVTMQTMRSPGLLALCASPAMPAAEAGSEKTPSSVLSSLQASRISSSVTVMTPPPDRSTASCTQRPCTGSVIRIADATVSGLRAASTGCSGGDLPTSSSKPRATARVLPPPPYGRTTTSGTPPSCLAISAATVIWPSIRSSLPPELTNVEPGSDARSSACANASENEPSSSTICPPTARTCTSFDAAIAPAGTTISDSIPARAAYAAQDAAVLPVEAQTRRVTPRST